MPDPLDVSCSPNGACAATLPAGLWLQDFSAVKDESPRAAAARFLGQASFGQTAASIEDLVDHFENDPAAWLAAQMAIPASRHRDYFRKRAWPPLPGPATCAADAACELGTDATCFRGADISRTNRGDAAAAAWIFRGVAAAPRLRGYFSDESRRRRGRDVDIPWSPGDAAI